jgi:hypothetical protein
MNSKIKRMSKGTGTQVKSRTKPVASTATQNGDNTNFAATTVRIDQDLHAWLLAQAQALRERRLDDLDWEDIAEELEGMAAKDRRALTSFLQVLLTHLLKWAYQTKERELHLSSWRRSILNARQEIEDSLEESPSLGAETNLDQFLSKAYRRARKLAAVDMGLSDREMNQIFPPGVRGPSLSSWPTTSCRTSNPQPRQARGFRILPERREDVVADLAALQVTQHHHRHLIRLEA